MEGKCEMMPSPTVTLMDVSRNPSRERPEFLAYQAMIGRAASEEDLQRYYELLPMLVNVVSVLDAANSEDRKLSERCSTNCLIPHQWELDNDRKYPGYGCSGRV